MIRLFKRTATTALRLPFAAAWDALTLANFGEGSSTGRVLREHQARAALDETIDLIDDVVGVIRKARRP